MYEKVVSFFRKHWFSIACFVGLGVLVFFGLKSIKHSVDTFVKNNKVSITINKSKSK